MRIRRDGGGLVGKVLTISKVWRLQCFEERECRAWPSVDRW